MWLFKTLGFGSSSFATGIFLELCSGSYIIKQERNLLCWIKLIKLSSSGSIEWHLPLLSQPKFYCCANFFHGDVALNENKVEVNSVDRTTVGFVELLFVLPSKKRWNESNFFKTKPSSSSAWVPSPDEPKPMKSTIESASSLSFFLIKNGNFKLEPTSSF